MHAQRQKGDPLPADMSRVKLPQAILYKPHPHRLHLPAHGRRPHGPKLVFIFGTNSASYYGVLVGWGPTTALCMSEENRQGAP